MHVQFFSVPTLPGWEVLRIGSGLHCVQAQSKKLSGRPKLLWFCDTHAVEQFANAIGDYAFPIQAFLPTQTIYPNTTGTTNGPDYAKYSPFAVALA